MSFLLMLLISQTPPAVRRGTPATDDPGMVVRQAGTSSVTCTNCGAVVASDGGFLGSVSQGPGQDGGAWAVYVTNPGAASTVNQGVGIDGGQAWNVNGTVNIGNTVTVTGSISATNPSVGTAGAAIPTSDTLIGASDGTNLQPLRTSTTTPAGTEQGLIVRPIPSGTQAVSAASLPLPTGAATETTLGTRLADATFTGRFAATAALADGTVNPSLTSIAGYPFMFNGTTWDRMRGATATGLLVNISNVSLAVTQFGGWSVSATQSGGWTVTVGNITGTVSLPTGAATSANQTTLGSQTTKLNDGTNTAAVKAASTPAATTDPALVVAVSPNNSVTVTQATAANLKATTASESATGSAAPATGSLAMGNTTTTAPTYTNSTANALSLTTAGALRTDSSATTQPVSGTVTANAGTGSFTVAQPTAANLNATVTGTVAATQSGTWNVTNVSGTVSLPTGASTAANQTTLGSQTTKINDGTNTAAVKPASTAAVATDPALVVAISPNNSLTVSNPSVGTTGSAPPSSAGLSGATATTAAPTYTTGTMNALSTNLSGGLRVDGSGVTQPVSAASLPLPTGAATSANQTTIGSQTTKLNDGTNSATIKPASTAAVATDTAIVVAISPNNSLTVGNASVSTNGSATPGSSTLSGGAVTTAAPSYTTGQMNALSLNTSGGLRVDGSGSTQPVSGTVTANAGTGNFTVTQATGSNLHVVVDTAPTTTVTGTVAATQSGTWNVTNVSGTVSLPTGASTEATLTKLPVAQASTTSGQSGPLVQGAVTTAAPTYTTATTNPLSLTTGGALRTDSSATTQPVSGTITANAGTGSFTVVQSTAANLRAQTAAESATGSAGPATGDYVMGAVTTAAPTYTTGTANALSMTTAGALRTDGSGVTQPISGSVTATISGTPAVTITSGTTTVTQATGSNLHVVVDTAPTTTVTGTVAATQSGTWTTSQGTVTSATGVGSCTSVSTTTTVLASNASRQAATLCARISNTDTIFVKLGATATTSNFPLEPGQCYNLAGRVYTGVVDSIANTGTQSVCTTELN